MTPPPLEDRLNRLADGLIAPPTPEAREAIGHRTGALRRRRRARQAAGVGVLVIAAVTGSIAVTRDTAPDTRSGYVDTDTDAGAVPALDVALDGWEVVTAEDTVAGAAVPPNDGEIQVFRKPGDVAGPRIVLEHSSASDVVVPIDDADDEVTVGEVVGYLHQAGTDSFILRWAPPLGDNHAEIEAQGLSRDEVLAFAAGLESKDDSIEFPASPDDRFGFVATEVPQGLVEVPSPEATIEDAPARRLVVTTTGAMAELTIEATGDAGYAAVLNDLAQAGSLEDVSVMGRSAVLLQHPGDLRWSLAWQPRPGTTARMVLSGVDRAGVDQVIGGLREIREDEWDGLVLAHRA